MTEKLQYLLELGVSDSADIEDVEQFLEQILLDIYEQGQVESIKVTKEGSKTKERDEDVKKLTDVVNDIDSADIVKAIESIKELENLGDNEQKRAASKC